MDPVSRYGEWHHPMSRSLGLGILIGAALVGLLAGNPLHAQTTENAAASSAPDASAATVPEPAERRSTPLTTAATAAAQQTAATATTEASSSAPPPAPLASGWREGFVLQNENGDFRLQLGLLVHADGRFALEDDSGAVTDTFLLRRVRPNLRGRFAKHFEFYLNPDFAGGTLVVQDAYIDTRFSQAFRIRVGKAKTPFGLERLQSASALLFFERALPTALVPNRDVGVQVLGDFAGGTVSYLAGVLNGVPDGASADLDTNDGRDVAARLVVRPFARQKESRLAGLGFAVSGSSGKQSGTAALPSFRSSSVQQTFFSYAGAAADGTRVRYSPQLFYYYKRFGGFGEYVHSELPIARPGVRQDIAHEAWQVAGSFVLTGETASESGVRPRSEFDFGGGHLGAFQVAARYHVLRVDSAAVALAFAAPGSSVKAKAWTAGLNWYLTPNFKYVLNFERTVFDGNTDGARKPENALVFRTQVNF